MKRGENPTIPNLSLSFNPKIGLGFEMRLNQNNNLSVGGLSENKLTFGNPRPKGLLKPWPLGHGYRRVTKNGAGDRVEYVRGEAVWWFSLSGRLGMDWLSVNWLSVNWLIL